MTDEIDPEKEFKHLRPGHVDLGRNCDKLVKYATKVLPGTGVLPQRWRYINQESFVRRFDHLGPIVWAKTASYHMLLINGRYVFRIWTDSPETCLCDICDLLAEEIIDSKSRLKVYWIPKNSRDKCKPFRRRTKLRTTKDVKKLLLHTASIFGLHK